MSDPKVNVVITIDGKEYISTLDKVDEKHDKAGKSAEKSASNINHLGRAVKIATGAMAAYLSLQTADYLLNEADAYRVLQARVQAATKDTGDYLVVSQRLYQLSKDNGVELENTVSLFQMLARTGPELKVTNAEILVLSDLVQKLGVIGGSSKSAMAAGLLQFSQSMSLGVFQAQEFNSIMENIPEVGARIAKGMGMTQGQLRLAVLSGNVLAKDVFAALLKQADEIARDFEEMPTSIDRASAELDNSFQRALSAIDDITGATSIWVGLLKEGADFGDRLADRLNETELQTLQRRRAMVMINYQNQLNNPLAINTDANRKVTMQLLDDLDRRIISLSRELTKQENSGNTSDTSTTTKKDPFATRIESAEKYGQRMYELARIAYPEATQSNEEYGQAMAKLLVKKNEAANSAYWERMAEAERITLDARTAAEVYTDEVIRLTAALERGDIGAETYVQSLIKAQEAMVGFGETGSEAMQELIAATRGWSRDFADRLLDNERGFEGFVNEILRQIARIGISTAMQPFFEGVGTFFGNMFGYAQGGVFQNGNVVPFATGGIVSQSVTFPMRGGKTGLMGEAGPEAIMPLKRTSSGDLGVQAVGMGGLQNLRIAIKNDDTPKKVKGAQLGFDLKGAVITIFQEDVRTHGPMIQSIKHAQGSRGVR